MGIAGRRDVSQASFPVSPSTLLHLPPTSCLNIIIGPRFCVSEPFNSYKRASVSSPHYLGSCSSLENTSLSLGNFHLPPRCRRPPRRLRHSSMPLSLPLLRLSPHTPPTLLAATASTSTTLLHQCTIHLTNIPCHRFCHLPFVPLPPPSITYSTNTSVFHAVSTATNTVSLPKVLTTYSTILPLFPLITTVLF